MDKGRSFKVGVFVAFGLLLATIATFMIGDARQAWGRKNEYKAAFDDVAGLKPGAPVRMGGVDVGTVSKVEHGTEVNDRKIYVSLSVQKSEDGRVRKDSRAEIQNKGLLGDKMVVLASDGKLEAAPPGFLLPTSEPADFTTKLGSIAERADQTVKNVEEATRAIADPKFRENLQESVEDVRLILDGVARKNGPAHRLLMDPAEGDKLDRILSNVEAATSKLDATLANARELTDQARTGPGMAHAVLYDGEMSAHAAGAMEEIHRDLTAIREGNGLVHNLVYGDDKNQHLMANVNVMSDDLRDIIHGVKQGKGTIGALLVDPSVYEDLKRLVGNVERNDVLRALVRYSIKADEKDAKAPKVTQ